ncbi:MAG: tail fiber domain-containing protein [Gammaproteobacteria bacterium]|nr:tail fiber domain-containing protein [Gammaproteobacteria bacterium]
MNTARAPSPFAQTNRLLILAVLTFTTLLGLTHDSHAGNDYDWARTSGVLRPWYLYDAVGLGVTTPQDVLHLYRPTKSTVGILMGNGHTGNDRRGFLVDYHAAGGAELWNFENTHLWFGTNNTWRMTLTNDGRLGIGTHPHDLNVSGHSNSSLKLDVQGMLRVHTVPVWNGPGKYDVTWARGCHEGSWGSTVCGGFENSRVITREGSSLRYKQNIEPLGLEVASRILDIETKTYEMREGFGPPGYRSVGLIAEELHEVGLTDLVLYDEKGQPDGVNYKKVALYTNEVVKAQEATILRLEASVARQAHLLERQAEAIAALTARLDSLSAPKR